MSKTWNEHLRHVYETTNLPLKDAMKVASKSYRKKGGTIKRRKPNKKVHFEGEGIYQDVINGVNKMFDANVEPLQDGEYHPPFANFMGPGTKLHEKLKKGIKPINKADAASMEHDIAYDIAMTQYKDDPIERAKAIRRADEYVIKQYDQSGELLGEVGKIGIKAKMAFEDTMPFIAKKAEKEYYGSRTGKGVIVKPTGEAHKLIVQTLHQ